MWARTIYRQRSHIAPQASSLELHDPCPRSWPPDVTGLRCEYKWEAPVRPEPGAQAAAAGLRASHADRERVIDLLKAAFVQGRLDRDELDERVGQALMSRTHAE